eukprot:scaffold50443_cov19-Tisochrysis_lutea.AAC.5
MHACTGVPEANYFIPRTCRLDPDNASLAADVDELRAALGPADIQALKQRGAARFQAGDHVGAVEAWGLLLSLPHDAVPSVFVGGHALERGRRGRLSFPGYGSGCM